MQSKNIIRPVIGTAIILLIPLALQLTIGTGVDGQGFNWKLNDFIVAGILLFVTGSALELAASRITPPYRIIIIAVIAAAFLLIWVELALDTNIAAAPFYFLF